MHAYYDGLGFGSLMCASCGYFLSFALAVAGIYFLPCIVTQASLGRGGKWLTSYGGPVVLTNEWLNVSHDGDEYDDVTPT